MAHKATAVIGWILGTLLSLGTFAQALAHAGPCNRLPFTHQTEIACKVLDGLQLRTKFAAATFR